MSVTIGPSKFWFGLMPEKPSLPTGWKWVEEKKSLLEASDSNGGRWLFYGKFLVAGCTTKNASVQDETREVLRRHIKTNQAAGTDQTKI